MERPGFSSTTSSTPRRPRGSRAATAEWNEPMRAVLRRLGFAEEGVLRAFFPAAEGRDDYVMYSLTRDEWLEAADGSRR